MPGFALQGLLGLVLLACGWFAGSLYPAPEQWTAFARGRSAPLLARIELNGESLAQLRETLSSEELARLTRNAAILAESSGEAIRIERPQQAALDEGVEAAAAVQRVSAATRPGGSPFDDALRLCPGMTVSHAPPADGDNNVRDFASQVLVNGVVVAVNPTHGACLSSGVGERQGRPHKGLDLHARDGGPILAAAPGTVIEKLYRSDYGNMLLIDHGSGVYTRYAHLSSFAPDVAVGTHVRAGQQIGLMGNTASYPIPVHLHYELLLGDYHNRAASFGLTPRSPFAFPPAPRTGDPMVAAAPPRSIVQLVAAQLTRGDHEALCAEGPIEDAAVVTVRRGDTLARIARACYGDSEAWRQLSACNPFLNERNRANIFPLSGGDLLYVGDRLALPAPGGACPT